MLKQRVLKTNNNQESSKIKKIVPILIEIVQIGNNSIEKLNKANFTNAWDLLLADMLLRFNAALESLSFLLLTFGNSKGCSCCRIIFNV